MKWPNRYSKGPLFGTRRTRHFFTWLPTNILGDIYWLEWVHVVEEWVPPGGGNAVNDTWVVLSQSKS